MTDRPLSGATAETEADTIMDPLHIRSQAARWSGVLFADDDPRKEPAENGWVSGYAAGRASCRSEPWTPTFDADLAILRLREELARARDDLAAFIGAVAERLERRQEGEWERDGLMVSCPECAFAFHAAHTQSDGSYKCPNCVDDALTELTDGLANDTANAAAEWASQLARWVARRDEDIAALERVTAERDRARDQAAQLVQELADERGHR